jgi:hypothetical protein
MNEELSENLVHRSSNVVELGSVRCGSALLFDETSSSSSCCSCSPVRHRLTVGSDRIQLKFSRSICCCLEVYRFEETYFPGDLSRASVTTWTSQRALILAVICALVAAVIHLHLPFLVREAVFLSAIGFLLLVYYFILLYLRKTILVMDFKHRQLNRKFLY